MKSFLQPKYILLVIVVVAAFFVIRNQLRSGSDILETGSRGGTCSLHGVRLRLDTVAIVVRHTEPDSLAAAREHALYPMAQDTFYLLSWFKDDEYKNYTRAQVWYCPKCREAKHS